MNRGYIRVWRKIEDSGIMHNPELCRLFLYLMLKASAKPRKQMIGNSLVALLPGQAVVGRKVLAAELGTTEGKIRSGLAALQKMEIINQRATNKYTIVSIVNWGRYQNGPAGHNQQTAGKTPSANPHPTTNKNEEVTHASPLPALKREKVDSAASTEFMDLRAYYDKHAREESPGAGIAEYRQCKAARTWPGLDAVFGAIDTLAALDDQWHRGYAPGLAKFLREQQWKKKPVPAKTNRDNGLLAKRMEHSDTRRAKAEGQVGPPCSAARVPAWAASGGDTAIMANLNTAAKVLSNRQEGRA